MWGFLMCWFQVAETEIYNPHQPKYHLTTSTPIKGLLLRKSQIWRHQWISNCIKAPRALNSNISGLLFFHFAMFSLFYLTQKKTTKFMYFSIIEAIIFPISKWDHAIDTGSVPAEWVKNPECSPPPLPPIPKPALCVPHAIKQIATEIPISGCAVSTSLFGVLPLWNTDNE